MTCDVADFDFATTKTQADGQVLLTGCVALWDTIAGVWGSFGGPLEGVVSAMVRNGTTVYIGGKINAQSSSVAFDGIAMYDGRDWVPIAGGGVSGGEVLALAVGSENLYVGGSFVMAGSAQVNRVARWDGVEWHAMGFLDGNVQALSTFGEVVYAGGDFTTTDGGARISRIARYYGGQWQQVGDGVDGTVFVITPIQECLYIGGTMTEKMVRTCIGGPYGSGGYVLEALNLGSAQVSTVRAFTPATHSVSPGVGTCVIPNSECSLQ